MTYSQAPNRFVTTANGVEFAYRETGSDTVPLVLLEHFRGNLDNWDPALVDALASSRRVIAFDNAGVGGSSGTTPHTVAEMARDAIAFVEAMGIDQADILGYSLGSFVAQEIALIRPAVVRRLVLASSAPQGAAGMHGWAPEVIDGVGARETIPDRSSMCSMRSHQRAGRLVSRLSAACSPEPRIETRQRRGRPGWRSTTRYAPGGFRTTTCSKE